VAWFGRRFIHATQENGMNVGEQRERQVLEAITRIRGTKQITPSYRELAHDIGVSTARVQQLIASLEQKGLVTRTPRAARAIVLSDAATKLQGGRG
jgi:DNA-binding MarR family transcriptional regulator